MMTDPIADMLTRVRNANTAMHDEVKMPSSKQKVALAEVLQREGYIVGYQVSPSPTGLDARPAGVPQRRQRAPRPRRPRCGRPVHLAGADDRPGGAQAQGRRRSPLLRLVIEEVH